MSGLVLDNIGWVSSSPPRWLKRCLQMLAALAVVLAMLIYLPGPVMALFIGPVDEVLVDKSARTISLLRGGKAVFSAGISLGKNPVGQKRREGDQRTPEGKYKLVWGNSASTHHKAILVSYPNKAQATRAAAKGEDAGGGIMIHGQRNWWRWFSRSALTNGCIGVSNLAMDVIWSAVELGTPIEIRP
ncbi:murein L,D-transpeptidase family protein [Dongia sp.]|uniref:L,D-transpeptidase family protein n=1 Tax=Dongia sp. TaxID=1977262 RepID=UPI0035AEA76E